MSEKRVIQIPLPGRAYDLVIGDRSLADGDCSELRPFVDDRSCLIVTDSNVDTEYAATTVALLESAGASRVEVSVFEAGEAAKSLTTLASLYSAAVAARLDRKSVIVALGGGVVGDTAGFLAASYMRGIDLVQVPTSLVAQVDSSIGGKTGVDLPEGKNLVGAFHQPRHVLIDVATLKTLKMRELRCGLAEVIKYGVILDADFFDFLEASIDGLLTVDAGTYRRVVERSCELKVMIVLEDEFETGRRAILNYGHTFGHALEKLTGYTVYTHGEAIAIGMGMAVDLGRVLEETPARAELARRQDALFTAVGLPTRLAGIEPAAILEAMGGDKKYVGGRNRLIVPAAIGTVEIITDVPDAPIIDAIAGRCD
ncbi:MAG TPA: 3-dehydroquinate synthase [Lentisphaeria bacterium]|nr:3-dehydroquinate synthase [Lentisphaeria bacterium]|tara:strand:+ start:274 stop:1380 length:1107 start_codon:yes stop_codon:yes gene_type:complete